MRGFVNPYNFISFPKQKAEAYPDKDVHTGVIEYTITTKTPLFIPNSSSDQAFTESDGTPDHKSYDFFSYEELDPGKRYENNYHVPVIPGSEMRGVVRTVYETLTDSCMGMLNTAEYPVKRVMESFQPALLHRENEKFVLYKASSLRIGSEIGNGKTPGKLGDCANGICIHYKKPPQNEKHQPGVIEVYGLEESFETPKKGYLIKWGMGVRKKRYHVFSLKDVNDTLVALSRLSVSQKLNPILESYLSQPGISAANRKAYEEYKKDLNDFLKAETDGYFPVCYSEISSNVFYLSPAVFSKEVANESLEAYAGEFAPCKEMHCPACDLFGYVGKDNTGSRGSDIRFSDLYVAEKRDAKEYYDRDKMTIMPLGAPKLGNVDFYLQKPDGAKFWTYDYYVKEDGTVVVERGKLRGRKFYWHHRTDKLIEQAPSNLNKTIRPVREGVCFRGKLFFDAVSQKQLDQLIWILNSGNLNLGLKLGGAKPLGFGSVACSVTKVLKRKVDASDGMIAYDMEGCNKTSLSYEEVGFSPDVKAEFLKIAGLDSLPDNVEVTYPKTIYQRGKSLTEGYQWFVNNHSRPGGGMPRKRADMLIQEKLPAILEDDICLSYNKKEDAQMRNNQGNYSQYHSGYGQAKNVRNTNRFQKR